LVLNWQHTRIFFGLSKAMQGITFSFVQQVYPSRGQLAGMLAGGIVANSLTAVAAFALWKLLPWGGTVWLLAAGLNAFMAVVNALPFAFRVGNAPFRSDGAQILHVLLRGAAGSPGPGPLHMLRSLRGLWEGVGDRLGLSVYLLDAAMAWRDLGSPEM